MNDLIPQGLEFTKNLQGLQGLVNGISHFVEIDAASRSLTANGPRVQELLDKAAADIEVADSLVVDSPDMLQEAQAISGRLAMLCADSGHMELERKALVKPFNDFVKKVNGGYNPAREYVQGVLSGLSRKVLAYNNEQRRIAQEKADADRRERERLAKEASEKEAAARKAAEDLAAEAHQAAAAGSTVVGQALADRAVAQNDIANRQAEVAVQALNTRVVVEPVAKAKGVRGKWQASVVNKAALLKHIGERTAAGDVSLIGLVDIDAGALNRLASIQGQNMALPGVSVEFVESLAVRKAA